MGLKHEDLKGTIESLISIDEFEPKSGSQEEVIVVAFHTIDEEPGRDLDDFIEKGALDFLDVEVSANPNPEGQFLVFVELERNDEFFDTFDALVKDVTNVAGEMDWHVRPYLADHRFNYLDDEWKDFVITLPDDYVDKDEFSVKDDNPELMPEEKLDEFFTESSLLTFEENDAIIVLGNAKSRITLERVDFGPHSQVFKNQQLEEAPLDLLNRDGKLADLNKMLGHGWAAIPLNEYVVINNEWSDRILLTRVIG